MDRWMDERMDYPMKGKRMNSGGDIDPGESGCSLLNIQQLSGCP